MLSAIAATTVAVALGMAGAAFGATISVSPAGRMDILGTDKAEGLSVFGNGPVVIIEGRRGDVPKVGAGCTSDGPLVSCVRATSLLVDLGGGDDGIQIGMNVPGRIEGGPGSDLLLDGSDAPRVMRGGPGDDSIRTGGTSAVETQLHGGGGDDDLFVLDGGALLRGGPGDDRVHGGAERDFIIPGAGEDTALPGSGRDGVRTRDGERDRIICVTSEDQISADRVDLLESC